MQVERGDRLWKFIAVSMAVHICLMMYSRYFRAPERIQTTGEIEVVLTPPEPAKPQVKTENKPEEKKPETPSTTRVAQKEAPNNPFPPKATLPSQEPIEKQVV